MNYPLPKILKINSPEYVSCPEYKDPIEAHPAAMLPPGMLIGIVILAVGLAAYLAAKRIKNR